MTAATKSWLGLAAYALTVLVGAAALGYDLDLYLSGQQTITEWAVERPGRAVGIVLLTAVGPLGLAAHFWYYRRDKGE